MKVAILFSGGKDSNYALFKASEYYEISCLIYLKSQNPNSYMFQNVGNEIIELQSKSLQLPLITHDTEGEKEKELEDLENAIIKAKEKFKIEGIVTGAIKSAYQSSRIQNICNKLNLTCFNPLWQIDEKEFLNELIENKFEIILGGIFSYPLTEKYLGKKINKKFLKEFNELNKRYSISIAGEGGEYESLVLNSPLFKQKLKIEKYNSKMDSENSGIIQISKIKKSNKIK